MNGNKNIIEIVSDLVSLMTPFVTVTSIEASGDLWRLNTCNTYWITLNSSIIIDDVEYIIKGIVQDSYIEIESITEPTVTEFQLLAPEFWHSSSRKVSGERSQKTDVRKPFVYLPVPRVTEDKVYDSDKAYDAEIKPVFLTNFDPQTDTIDLQQEYIIEPLNAMANFFVYLIEDDLVNFDDLATIDRKEWMNFGDEVVWGNDKKIFKENLSGVELSFTLPVFKNESCDCSVVSKVCADASVYINDVFYTFVESGGTVNIITGVCDPATVNINGVFNQTVASGGTLDIEVEYETSLDNPIQSMVANKIIIVDPIVLPTNRIYLRPEPTGEIYVPDSAFYLDGCDSWMVHNNIDPIIQTSLGIAMVIDKSKRWKLIPDNVFGHKFRFTGSTGGYYDPETLSFYDSDGTISTYASAFPADYMIDNSTGLGWQTLGAVAVFTFENALINVASLSHAGFNDWFLPNLSQLTSVTDYGYGSPLGSTGDFNPIFTGGITNSTKWTSTTIKGLETRVWVLAINGGVVNNTLKTNITRYIGFRFHFS
jgi:hypothetical protein